MSVSPWRKVKLSTCQRAVLIDYDKATGRGLHSFPFPLNLSLLCHFPLNFSLICPPNDPTQPMEVSKVLKFNLRLPCPQMTQLCPWRFRRCSS